MGTRLYVGNLPYRTTDEELLQLFSRAGEVREVQVMRDAATGRARGFAFVQMATEEGAEQAIKEFHQYQLDGRALVVNVARPRTERPRAPQAEGDPFGLQRREPRW